MATYHINLEDDVLKVGFNPNSPANNNQIVQDAAARLDEMIVSGELSGGSLLKINGPASVPVCYVIRHLSMLEMCLTVVCIRFFERVSNLLS